VQETGHSPNKVLTMVHVFLIEMTPLYTPHRDVLGSSVHGLNYAWSCSHAVFSTRMQYNGIHYAFSETSNEIYFKEVDFDDHYTLIILIFYCNEYVYPCHILCLSQGFRFPTSYVMIVFVFSDLR
jgi:hypothetical protein